MPQKQLKPEVAAADGGTNSDARKGNNTAKMAAEKSGDAIEKLNAVIQTERAEKQMTYDARIKDIADYILREELRENPYEIPEGKTPMEKYMEQVNDKAKQIVYMIDNGMIDPATLTWRDKRAGLNGMICFCLVPTCNIGHFIPIRM